MQVWTLYLTGPIPGCLVSTNASYELQNPIFRLVCRDQETAKDPENESQQRSVTDPLALSDYTEVRQNKCFGGLLRKDQILITSWTPDLLACICHSWDLSYSCRIHIHESCNIPKDRAVMANTDSQNACASLTIECLSGRQLHSTNLKYCHPMRAPCEEPSWWVLQGAGGAATLLHLLSTANPVRGIGFHTSPPPVLRPAFDSWTLASFLWLFHLDVKETVRYAAGPPSILHHPPKQIAQLLLGVVSVRGCARRVGCVASFGPLAKL